jgi:hypothetical protein
MFPATIFLEIAEYKMRFYKPKEGNPSRDQTITNNFGVLEYRSVAEMGEALMSFLSTRQYPITPEPRPLKVFGQLKSSYFGL